MCLLVGIGLIPKEAKLATLSFFFCIAFPKLNPLSIPSSSINKGINKTVVIQSQNIIPYSVPAGASILIYTIPLDGTAPQVKATGITRASGQGSAVWSGFHACAADISIVVCCIGLQHINQGKLTSHFSTSCIRMTLDYFSLSSVRAEPLFYLSDYCFCLSGTGSPAGGTVVPWPEGCSSCVHQQVPSSSQQIPANSLHLMLATGRVLSPISTSLLLEFFCLLARYSFSLSLIPAWSCSCSSSCSCPVPVSSNLLPFICSPCCWSQSWFPFLLFLAPPVLLYLPVFPFLSVYILYYR